MARAPARHPRTASWLGKRTTGDILVLLIAGTVCLTLIATGATVAVIVLVHPDRNVSVVVGMIGDTINTMIGLLAGFIAGRTDYAHDQPPPDA